MIRSAQEMIEMMAKSGQLPENRDSEIASLISSRPTIHSLTQILDIKPARLDPSDRIDYLTAFDKHLNWLQAKFQEAIIAVAGDRSIEPEVIFDGVDQSEREDVATALRISPNTAQEKINVARTLTLHLPNTCAALASGEISAQHASSIAREIDSAIREGLPVEAITEVESVAISHAEFHTPRQVERKVRSVLAKLAPETFAETVDRAMATRTVRCSQSSDGMSEILAILPAADAQVVMNAIESFVELERDQEARGVFNGELDRTIEMRRADALTSIANLALSLKGDAVKHHRRPASINVAIDLPTLLGLAENPGYLTGYGPIPADIARNLASDGKWKRFITDPTSGNLLEMGREVYIPPQHLQDFLIARDRICRFPGCRRSAEKSEIDHAIPWEEGGETNASNLGALCKRHHRLKTHGGWKLKSFADGSCEWTAPDGRIIPIPARPLLEAV